MHFYKYITRRKHLDESKGTPYCTFNANLYGLMIKMPRTVDSPIYQKAQILDALRDTGALIAEARKARGWSQTDLGARLGKVDRRHVSALEKGDPKVDVGLVVAALWLLDLPLLATLPQPGHAAPTGYYRVAESRAGARRPASRRRFRPQDVDNDF
ncbi:MAG: transcriptional regulator with XRE-family HTH domain [Alloalcanivorax venustensis]|jgi:transcriptional regulator with XRE-family HTH domain